MRTTKTLLAGFALGAVAGYTGLRAHEAWRDLQAAAPSRERDPKSYAAARRSLAVVSMARSAATVGAWAFVAADPADLALARVPTLLRLPLFAAGVTLIEALRETPIDYVEEYVLERIYGNSDRSARDWVSDRVKATGVGLIATVVLSTAGGAVLRRAPRRWPWVAIAATPPLLAFANVIVPTFVMPLFNKFVPVEGALERQIRALAAEYGVGEATILRFDMSRQTKKANAFVTGVFGTERIALADTLIEKFADDETLFVVAHELGHYVRKDPWAGIALATALIGTTVIAARSAVDRTTGGATGEIGTATRLLFYISLGQLVAMPLANRFSRAIERRADRFAVEATGDAGSGVRAFERLREQNLAEDEGPKWAELLLASHPSLKSRIAALRASA